MSELASIYLFELELFNGFLNKRVKVIMTLKTDCPAAVIESDFKEKIKAYGLTYTNKKMQLWESRGVKYISKIGL